MKEHLVDTWVPKIIQHCKKVEKGPIVELMNSMDKALSNGEVGEKGKLKICIVIHAPAVYCV